MKIKKDLSSLVESDYTPLTHDQEGKLSGGFGSITVVIPDQLDGIKINFSRCHANPQCVNDGCTVNNCPPPTTRPTGPPPPPPDGGETSGTIIIHIS